MMRQILILHFIFMLLILPACGGGGGSSSGGGGGELTKGEDVPITEEPVTENPAQDNSAYGSISGLVVTANGSPQSSVHVRAVSTTDPDVQIGQFTQDDGTYFVGQIPEGDYKLIVEDINGRGGVERIGISNATLAPTPIFPDEYYNGLAEAADDDPLEYTTIHVTASQTTTDINLNLNDSGEFANRTEYPIADLTPLSVPDSVMGTLGESTDFTDDWGLGYFIDAYTLSGTLGQVIDINLGSLDFDTFLTVVTPDGGFLVDDDSGGYTDSFISVVIDSIGEYIIVVTSYDTGEKGDYSLIVQEASPPDFPSISPNITSSGSLDAGDMNFDGYYVDVYSYYGTAGETISLSLTSSLFDTYLMIVSPSENIETNDDWDIYTNDSKIQMTLLETGKYLIIVTSYDTWSTGSYSLILDNGSGSACTDNDNDGYYSSSGCGTEVDCNDGNSSINPGAIEICGNGIDENCSGADLQCSGQANVILKSINEMEDYSGNILFYGELENIGNKDAVFVKIEFEFRDVNGNLIDTDYTYVSGTTKTLSLVNIETNAILTPGEVGFFVAYTLVPRTDVAYYYNNITWDEYDTEDPDADIRLIQPLSSYKCAYGGWCLDGFGKNFGSQPAIFTWVELYLKDNSGNVFGWGFASIDGAQIVDLSYGGTTDAIFPDETAGFSASEYGVNYSDVGSYQWKIDWSDYSSVAVSALSSNAGVTSNSMSMSISTPNQKRSIWEERKYRTENNRLLAEELN